MPAFWERDDIPDVVEVTTDIGLEELTSIERDDFDIGICRPEITGIAEGTGSLSVVFRDGDDCTEDELNTFSVYILTLSVVSPELAEVEVGLIISAFVDGIFVGNDCADPKSDCCKRLEATTVTIFLSGRIFEVLAS